MAQLPNPEGIAALIAIIKARKQHFVMNRFVDQKYTNRKGEACGTAYCIAGYATMLRGRSPEDATDNGADDLKSMLAPSDGANKEFSDAIYDLWAGHNIHLADFDEMPETKRKATAIDVLEHFAKTGKVEWRKFAEKYGYVHKY